MKLAELRRKIDRIDADIVRLLNKRTRYAVKIGHIKQAEDIPVFVPRREHRLLARLHALNRGPLPDESLRHIYREIMSAARSIEGGLDIACIGISADAARAKFGDSVSYLRCSSHEAAMKAIGRKAHLAVLPARAGIVGAIDEFEHDGRKFAIVTVSK